MKDDTLMNVFLSAFHSFIIIWAWSGYMNGNEKYTTALAITIMCGFFLVTHLCNLFTR